MLTQENIDEINRVLPLTGSVRLTKDEIDYLNAIDTTVYQDSDIYLITQTVLLLRLRNQKCGGDALSRLHKLALSKGFELKEKKPKPKKAIIPIIGGMVGGIRPVTGDFTLELPTPIPPEVIKQPKSMTIDEEQSVSFSAEAINYNSVWWEYSSDSGSTWLYADGIPNWQTTMLGPFVTPLIADGYKFKAMFDGEGGVTASNIAVLTVKMIPPQVTLHPVLADVDEWEMVTFTAGANEYDSVKWMRSAAGVTWEDANMFPNWQTETIGPLEAVLDLDGYSFKAVFSNDAGDSETTSALLSIHQIKPVLILNPESSTVTDGGMATFTAVAKGYDSVVWKVNTCGLSPCWEEAIDLPNYDTAELGPFNVDRNLDGYEYMAVFSNDVGDSMTSIVVLTVDDVLPIITEQPISRSVDEGSEVSFSSLSSNFDNVKWMKKPVAGDWIEASDIDGWNTVLLGPIGAVLDLDGYSFKSVFDNKAGETETEHALLSVSLPKAPPVIIEQPNGQSGNNGDTVTFDVDGYNVLTYKWQESSCEPTPCFVDVPSFVGWETRSLQVPVEKTGHNFQYRCVLGNDYGETMSDSAILTVNTDQRYIVPKVFSSTFAGYEKGAVGGDNTYGIFNPTLFEGVDVTKLVANSSSSNYITLALSDEIESTQLTISTDGKNFRVNKVTDTGYTNTIPSDVDSLMSTFSANDGIPIGLDIYINGNTDFIITPAAISASSAGYYAFNADGGSLKPIYIDGIAIFSILASTSGGKITVELNSEIDSKSELSIKFNGEMYDGFIARPTRLKDLTKASSYKYELSNQAKADKLYADFTAVIGVESPMTIEVKQTSFAYTLTVGKKDTLEQVLIGKNHSYNIGFLEPTEILDGSIEDIFMKLDSYGDYKLHLVLDSEPTGWYSYKKEITIGTLAPITLNSSSTSAYITVTEFNYLDGEVGNDLPVSIKLLPVLTKDITTKGGATLEVGNVQDRDKTA